MINWSWNQDVMIYSDTVNRPRNLHAIIYCVSESGCWDLQTQREEVKEYRCHDLKKHGKWVTETGCYDFQGEQVTEWKVVDI